MSVNYRIPVSKALRAKIDEIRDGRTWRVFDADWWPASHSEAWNIVEGRRKTTTMEIYDAVDVKPPPIYHINLEDPRIAVFGEVGYFEKPPDDSMVLIVFRADQATCCEPHCEGEFTKWPPNRKRCSRCAAATPAARRLAAEAEICVAEVASEGRVFAKDVKGYIG